MDLYAGVVRVSHMGDRKAGDEKFHADEDQTDPINSWAKSQGVRVDFLEPELDVSGGWTLDRRPSLRAAVEGIEQGIYVGLVVAYLSRMGRNIREQLKTWDRIEAAGGRVVSVREGIDTSTASGRLHRNLLMAIDEHEREQHAERFARRRMLATEAGIWQCRQIPRGFDKGADRRLAINLKEAAEVQAAFADFLAGTASMPNLAKRMKMSSQGVRGLLSNRLYLGELTIGTHTNPAAYPAIIEQGTFDDVQRKLNERVRPARSKKERAPALLAGLIRCSACGHQMTRSTGAAGFYYKCRKNHSGVVCPAPAAVRVEQADEYVEQIALAELERLRVEAHDANSEIEALMGDVATAEGELATYLAAVSAAEIGAEAFAAGARQRRNAVDTAKDALWATKARQPAEALVGSGAEVWKGLDPHERNTLLRSLFAVILIRSVGRGRRTPSDERIRVIAYGTDVDIPTRAGWRPQGLNPIPFPNLDAVGVLTVPAGEDCVEAAGSAN